MVAQRRIYARNGMRGWLCGVSFGGWGGFEGGLDFGVDDMVVDLPGIRGLYTC